MISQHTKTVGLVTAIFALISVSVLGVLLYLLAAKETSVQSNAQAHADAEQRRLQLNSLVSLVEESRADREDLKTFILTDDSVIDFLALLESVAASQGLTLETNSLSQEALPDTDTFELLVLSLNVKGSLSSVTHMMSLIENLPYQVSVHNVILSDVGFDDFGAAEWRGNFTIKVTKQTNI